MDRIILCFIDITDTTCKVVPFRAYRAKFGVSSLVHPNKSREPTSKSGQFVSKSAKFRPDKSHPSPRGSRKDNGSLND